MVGVRERQRDAVDEREEHQHQHADHAGRDVEVGVAVPRDGVSPTCARQPEREERRSSARMPAAIAARARPARACCAPRRAAVAHPTVPSALQQLRGRRKTSTSHVGARSVPRSSPRHAARAETRLRRSWYSCATAPGCSRRRLAEAARSRGRVEPPSVAENSASATARATSERRSRARASTQRQRTATTRHRHTPAAPTASVAPPVRRRGGRLVLDDAGHGAVDEVRATLTRRRPVGGRAT